MKITEQELLHIAGLARLGINDEEVREYTRQVTTILDYMAILNSLDTTGVPPTSQAVELNNVLREDEAGPSMDPDEVLKNAPEREENAYIVPRVV